MCQQHRPLAPEQVQRLPANPLNAELRAAEVMAAAQPSSAHLLQANGTSCTFTYTFLLWPAVEWSDEWVGGTNL